MFNVIKFNELRKKEGLAIRQLASLIGVPNSTLGSLPKHKNPKLDVILAICKYFKVSPNELIILDFELPAVEAEPKAAQLEKENENLKRIIELQEKLLKKEEV